MSQEKIFRTLASFGLTRTDVKVYIYLAKKGPRKGKELLDSLKITKQQLYPCLKKLQTKKIVTVSCKRPAIFSALPFAKVLDMFIEANIKEVNQVKHLTQKTQDFLSGWQAMKSNKSNNSP